MANLHPLWDKETAICPECGIEINVHPDGAMYAHGKFRKGENVFPNGFLDPVIWCKMSDKPAPKAEEL